MKHTTSFSFTFRENFVETLTIVTIVTLVFCEKYMFNSFKNIEYYNTSIYTRFSEMDVVFLWY